MRSVIRPTPEALTENIMLLIHDVFRSLPGQMYNREPISDEKWEEFELRMQALLNMNRPRSDNE